VPYKSNTTALISSISRMNNVGINNLFGEIAVKSGKQNKRLIYQLVTISYQLVTNRDNYVKTNRKSQNRALTNNGHNPNGRRNLKEHERKRDDNSRTETKAAEAGKPQHAETYPGVPGK